MNNPEPLHRHQILLYKGDFERLQSIYQTKKPTSVIRDLVRKHVDEIERKERERNAR